MTYIEARIIIHKEDQELFMARLLEQGITDIQIDDPEEISELVENLGATEWYDKEQVEGFDTWATPEHPSPEEGEALKAGEIGIRAYFDGDVAGAKKAQEIVDIAESEFGGRAFLVSVNDAEWKDRWKEWFKPTKVGDKIVVCPTWEIYEAEEGELVIRIDPGMAFGTGTHETTSLAIKMLEKYLAPGMNVLDVGTGSGILAIASALLGAREVLGIDIDKDAVDVANENIALNIGETNGESPSVKAIYGDLTKGVDYKADILVANLLADLVIILSKDALRHIKDGGIYITSGILREKEAAVARAIEESGFKILETMYDGEWCSIAAGRR